MTIRFTCACERPTIDPVAINQLMTVLGYLSWLPWLLCAGLVWDGLRCAALLWLGWERGFASLAWSWLGCAGCGYLRLLDYLV